MDLSPLASKPSPIALITPLFVVVALRLLICNSAVHSHTLPIISVAPAVDSHPAFEPVGVDPPLKLHPEAGPEAVPEAAICHSDVVASRLPALAQACWAWYQVMDVEGFTEATLRA